VRIWRDYACGRRQCGTVNGAGQAQFAALVETTLWVVLIDEEAGRNTARSFGLSVRGSLGVLIEAYHNRLIGSDQLRFYFAEIERRNDIWVSPTLCRSLLAETLGDD
jgi:predicted nucleic acid-binding protein